MVSTMATVFNLGSGGDDVQPLRQILREAIDTRDRRAGVLAARRHQPDGLLRAGLPVHVHASRSCDARPTRGAGRIAMLVMMNAMAWLASFAVYQGGRLLGYGA